MRHLSWPKPNLKISLSLGHQMTVFVDYARHIAQEGFILSNITMELDESAITMGTIFVKLCCYFSFCNSFLVIYIMYIHYYLY